MSTEMSRKRFLQYVALSGASLVLPWQFQSGTARAAASLAASTSANLSGATPIRIPPVGHAYFGVQLSWDVDSPSHYVARLGRRPAIYGDYVPFPLSATECQHVMVEARQAANQGGTLMLTVMPNQGLSTVTAATSRVLAQCLAQINAAGTPVIVRFAHEMNGSWYPWGQRPAQYRAAFRMVAAAVHHLAPGSAMMWAPNYGGGYPFNGGAYNARSHTSVFEQLDTNHDGRLNMQDDPYAPYYPGNDAVDWVGLTLYHWGNHWPWGANQVPERSRFLRAVLGTYSGLLGDERSLPNFYQIYAADRRKPLAIAETAALYNTNPAAGRSVSALAVKSAWWAQIFSPVIPRRLPLLHMVLWFEHIKPEVGVSVAPGPIDWRVTVDPGVRAAFRHALPPWLVFGEVVP
jgi:hypothetical protein